MKHGIPAKIFLQVDRTSALHALSLEETRSIKVICSDDSRQGNQGKLCKTDRQGIVVKVSTIGTLRAIEGMNGQAPRIPGWSARCMQKTIVISRRRGTANPSLKDTYIRFSSP